MLTSFKNFRTHYEFILESAIEGSTEFLEKLKKIKKEKGKAGQIAKFIIDAVDEEDYFDSEELKQNYFDITDKDDMVSFISQSKVNKKMEDDEASVYSPYKDKGRNETKIGRVVKSLGNLIGAEFSDKDIEAFVDIYKSLKFESEMSFELVKGNDIKKCYNSNKYYSENGSMGGSCMNDEKDYFSIYTQNPTNCGLLIFKDAKGVLYGRALVWKLSKSPCDGKIFMDRIYTNRESDRYKFIEYAKEKGWIYKSFMNSHVDTNVKVMYRDKEYYGEMNIELNCDFDKYPFLDTLCFLDSKKKILSNLPSKNSYTLQSVSGECNHCVVCKGSMYIYTNRFCYNCAQGHETLSNLGVKVKVK